MGRRRKGEPPAYKVHPVRGYAYVHLNGEIIYLGKHPSQQAKEKYQQIVQQWERDHLTAPVPREGTTIIELVSQFMDHARVHYRIDGEPTSELRSFRHNLAPLVDQFARMKVDDFRPSHFKAIREHWLTQHHATGKDGKTKKQLSRKTINQAMGRIRHVFQWGVGEELVEPATAMAIAQVKDLQEGRTSAPDHEDVPPVGLRDFAKTLKHLCRHYAAIARIQYYCGARPGEVCRMRGEEIDRDGIARIGKRRIFVGNGLWVFQPRRFKTKHKIGNIVYLLGPRAQRVLEPFLRDDPIAYIFPAGEVRQERYAAMRAARKSKVQPSQVSRAKVNSKRPPSPHITPTTYAHAVQDAAARAGAEHWHPNQVRHLWFSRMDRLAGIEAASKAGGHKSIDTTLVYVEKNLKDSAPLVAEHG